jgi:hypothetical protein
MQCKDEPSEVAHKKLEAILSRVTPENEQEWALHVLSEMRNIAELIQEHVSNDEGPDGLMTEIHATVLAVSRSMSSLKESHKRLLTSADLLIREIEDCAEGEQIPVQVLMKHAESLMEEMRHHKSLSACLVIEAFAAEIGGVD